LSSTDSSSYPERVQHAILMNPGAIALTVKPFGAYSRPTSGEPISPALAAAVVRLADVPDAADMLEMLMIRPQPRVTNRVDEDRVMSKHAAQVDVDDFRPTRPGPSSGTIRSRVISRHWLTENVDSFEVAFDLRQVDPNRCDSVSNGTGARVVSSRSRLHVLWSRPVRAGPNVDFELSTFSSTMPA